MSLAEGSQHSELWVKLVTNGRLGQIVGNCHTFPGRFAVWTQEDDITRCTSKDEIDEASPESWWWLNGFLHGAVPRPPEDTTKEEEWRQRRADFLETGNWKTDSEELAEATTASEIMLVGTIVDRSTELLRLLDEHLDERGDLLPDVFMADVARWMVERYSTDARDASLLSVLSVLETYLEEGRVYNDQRTIVSLVRNLPDRADLPALYAALGPALKNAIADP